MLNKDDFYFQTLINSWKAVWHNKILWFFALFSLFLGGGQWNSFLSANFSNFFKEDGIAYNLYQIIFSGNALENFITKVSQEPVVFLVLLLILFLLTFAFLLFVYISVVFQGGLIYSIFKVNLKQKINIHNSLTVGKNNFWQVLSLNIMMKFVIWGFSFLLAFFSLMSFLKDSTGAVLIFSFSSIFIILFLFLLSFIFRYALSYIVLKGRDSMSAIKEAFNLFFKNWIINLEVAAFLFVINYIFLFFAIWSIKIIMIPISSIGTFSLYLSSGVSFGFYFIFIPILISLFILTFFTVLSAYNYCVWVALFMRLTGNKKVSSLTKYMFLKLKRK
jgi:hypothetical protein